MKTNEYDDIINLQYPFRNEKHQRMTPVNRAKIFAPFAALRGYEEALEAKEKIVVPRIELSEDTKEIMDRQLVQLKNCLQQGKHPIVTIVYFRKDRVGDELGEYIRFTGKTVKLESDTRTLQIVDRKLLLDDIYRIESKELE